MNKRHRRVDVWTAAAGVGLVALMVSWVVSQRLAALIGDPPTRPVVALASAMVTSLAVTGLAGWRLGGAVRD